MKFIGILVTLLIVTIARAPAQDLNSLETRLSQNGNYVRLSATDGLATDLRYDTPDNFLHQAVYGDFNACFLHRLAAQKIKLVVEDLKIRYPNLKLILFDCLRPRSVQRKMWDIVKGTPQQKYVGDPGPGSVHNFGLAVDLSLQNANGTEVDMGTPFDFFGPEAEPSLEQQNLSAKKITALQLKNRLILRRAMEKQGFHQLPTEWWHFDAFPPSQVRKEFKIVE